VHSNQDFEPFDTQPTNDIQKPRTGVSITLPRVALASGAVLLLAAGVTGGFISGRLTSDEPVESVASPTTGVTAGTSGAKSLAPGAATPGGSGAKLRPVDGGLDYYGKFSPALPTDDTFFPVGIWYSGLTSKAEAEGDKAMGINLYVEVTENTDLAAIKAAGMYAIHDRIGKQDAETVGWMLSDEADMWAGPGSAKWTGSFGDQGAICEPAEAQCGFTVQQRQGAKFPKDKRMRYSNFGKGITFPWDKNQPVGRFVNEFVDVLSVDNYWFTDKDICNYSQGGRLLGKDPNQYTKFMSKDECHRPSNYGLTVDTVRKLVKPAGSKPIWNFVELARLEDTAALDITPPQITAAVWSSIIHGARGIVYFNHSFGGKCPTDNVIRNSCFKAVQEEITKTNSTIKKMAPVLNAPFAGGVAKAGAGADVSVKWYDGHFYLIAGANRVGSRDVTFTMPCVGDATITVLDEDRTIKVTGGTFTDKFANANAVHRYRVDGGSSCGAY
jgi:hypothetical protein